MQESTTILDYTKPTDNYNNISYEFISQDTGKTDLVENGTIRDFLFEHLEQYGDTPNEIQKAINYIFEQDGGLITVQYNEEEISGVCLINKTGMDGYIPENILVYIANQKKFRGKGLGAKLLRTVIENTQGDIALHVEKDNPAVNLYNKLGFKNPYLEMRLKR